MCVMRSWLLLPCVALACASDQLPGQPTEQRAAPLALLPESDQPASPVLGHAQLAGGQRVEARAGAEPGESDLWLVDASGSAAPLAPAPGPDEKPVALPDGRVAFVSGRSTVMSLWVVEPTTENATQLTNHGLVAGKLGSGFIPPPSGGLRVDGRTLSYEDGSGQSWQVEVAP